MKRRRPPPPGTPKLIVPEHPQNSKDSEILEEAAYDTFNRTGKQQRIENRLSVETKLSEAIRLGIAALGVAICVLIVCLAIMYCVLILKLTFHFFNDVPMLIKFLTATWHTITSASAAAVPFLIYLLRKETKDR